MFKSSSSTGGDLNGFLDAGSHIMGDLHFEDTFRIDGKVTGKIISSGDLIIGENGVIDGEVQVTRIFVSGTVKGSLEAEQRVELLATSKVYADIYTPVLTMEEGAFLEGRCSMKKREKSSRVEHEKVTHMPVAKTAKTGDG
jgi:cytoskeletal protein CcmA (bactofilin family)